LIAFLPFALGLAAAMSVYTGGMLALRFARHRAMLFGLTGGLVMGVAFFDLLPEALEHGAGRYGGGVTIGLTVVGFALYLVFHRLPGINALGRLTLVFHGVMDGLGIGLAFQISSAMGWLVAAAVLAHDLADGANMIGLSMAAGHPGKGRNWLIASALAPLAGIGLGQMVHIDLEDFALVLSILAGGFLYIGACELLPHSREAEDGLEGVAASLLGIALMAVVVQLVH